MHQPHLSLQVSRLCWSCSTADRSLSFPCQDDKRIVFITAGSSLGSQIPAVSSSLAVDAIAKKEKVYLSIFYFITAQYTLAVSGLFAFFFFIDDKMRNKMYL